MNRTLALHRLLKVQNPAITLKRPHIRFGAHNFIALQDPEGRIVREIHGIARGRDGAQLRIYGGVLPFRREYIWGETFDRRTGFYDEAYPQGVLAEGTLEDLAPRLAAAEAVRAWVNARHIPYPWPALVGDNSNAYYATALAAMGLDDIRAPGQLWAPSGRRLLAPPAVLAALRAGTGGEARRS